MFQSFNLFPQYSVIDNIMLAPRLAAKEQIKQTGEYMGAKIIKTHKNYPRNRIELARKSGTFGEERIVSL